MSDEINAAQEVWLCGSRLADRRARGAAGGRVLARLLSKWADLALTSNTRNAPPQVAPHASMALGPAKARMQLMVLIANGVTDARSVQAAFDGG
jgi:L-asparaginase